MKFNEIDDVCISKYNSVKDIFTKSRIMKTQFLSIIGGLLVLIGQQVINIFNNYTSQIQVLLDPKYFALVSIICGLLTSYFKYKTEKEKLEQDKKDKLNEELSNLQRDCNDNITIKLD